MQYIFIFSTTILFPFADLLKRAGASHHISMNLPSLFFSTLGTHRETVSRPYIGHMHYCI